MTTPSKLDEARLRELADWFRDGDPGGEGSVLLSRSVAIEAGNDIALVLDALSAERERADRAVEAMPDLYSVIHWLENGCDPKHAANELRIYRSRVEAFLATQKAEG